MTTTDELEPLPTNTIRPRLSDAFTARIYKGAKCQRCNRKTPHRKTGRRAKHRVEADNPLAPYCEGDDDMETDQ